MNGFQFFIICKRTNNASNATHYVKLGKKRRKSSKRNYYIISPRVITKPIIIIYVHRWLKPLYGMPPTARAWHTTMSAFLPKEGCATVGFDRACRP